MANTDTDLPTVLIVDDSPESIDVLRGPQGTLYGRNATGGLVHFISKRPTEELSAAADLTVGEYSQVKFEGAVGGSIGQKVQGRLFTVVVVWMRKGYV